MEYQEIFEVFQKHSRAVLTGKTVYRQVVDPGTVTTLALTAITVFLTHVGFTKIERVAGGVLEQFKSCLTTLKREDFQSSMIQKQLVLIEALADNYMKNGIDKDRARSEAERLYLDLLLIVNK